MRARLETEVLVIGSGAGGAVVAATLAEAGHDVTILEEGQPVQDASLATHSPAALQTLYRNGGLSPILGRPTIAYVEGCCVGGSTEVNSAFWHRTPAAALDRWRARWQLQESTPAHFARLFDELERELQPATLPEAALPPGSVRFREGAAALGWQARQVPRVQAAHLGGSAYAPGAKRSMSVTYLPRALRAGARLLDQCRVTRLHQRHGRVSHVSARQQTPDGGRRLRIVADAVFVCAGTIQTPVLLRASGITRNVGDTLCIHPMLKVAALFDELLDSHTVTLPVYQVSAGHPDITLGGSVFTPGYLALTLADNWPTTQAALPDWRQMALYYVACRGQGQGSVRVVPLSGEALVRYHLAPRDQHYLNEGLAALGRLLFAGGARRLYPALRAPASIDTPAAAERFAAQPVAAGAMSLSTVHAFSTCPLGEDAQHCAADSFGRVRGIENLYIADASLIPDSPGVNPQGTVMALALRNARAFLAHTREKKEL